LNDKAAYAHRVVTRMCFDPVVTTGWAQHIARDGVALQVIAGMPGPVNRQKLIRISASLGLGSSARFLQKQHGLWRFFLPGAYNPTRLLKGLAAAAPLVTGIHVVTFNEFAGAEEWRRKLRRDVGLG